MQTVHKRSIENRLQAWKLFFESEQRAAMGYGPTVTRNDPRLIPVGADYETHGVDVVIESAMHAAGESLDRDLFEMAELVSLLSDNYMKRMDLEYAASLMLDFDNVLMLPEAPELDAALAAMTPARRAMLADAAAKLQ